MKSKQKNPPKKIFAFCYASGLIKFGQKVPEGAISIAHGPAYRLRSIIHAQARWSYPTTRGDGRTEKPLVPGIPEAADQMAALAALGQFCRRVKQALEAA